MRAGALCLFLLVLGAGCAQPPKQELTITAARLEAARQQDAALFAPELFAEAEHSFAEANRLVESERDYLGAIQAAAHATLRANEALSRATTERTVVVRKLDRLLFELESLLEIAGYRGARVEAPLELAAFESRYETIQAMVKERDLLDALAAATALKPEILRFEERFHPQ